MSDMIDLTKPDLKWSDFRIVEAPKRELPDKVFIPFFRVKKGEEVIERRKYKVTKMPAELYALFQKEL